MPFGLQVTGRFRGDRDLLDAAESMEHAFATIPGLGRPRADLARLTKPLIDLKSIVTHPPISP
jgi:amidase